MNSDQTQENYSNYQVGLDGYYEPYDFWLSLNGLYDHYAYTLKLFGSLQNKTVLDCGCGRGHTSVMMAKHGAAVTGFDLSEQDIAIAKKLAENNEVEIKLSSQRIEEMSYSDKHFDYAFGACILHHVDLPSACKEIDRILKPGGKAIFIENSARNLFLMVARKWVVGSFGIPKYGDDDEEHPLTNKDLKTLKEHFPGKVTVHYPDFLFFRLLDFYIFQKKSTLLTKSLKILDNLIGKIPVLNQYGYFQIIEFNKQ